MKNIESTFDLFFRYQVSKLSDGFDRCDFTVDDLQIVNAATHGAAAITLSPDMTDDLKSQVDMCKKHNMEAIVMIRSTEEGASTSALIHYNN